MRLLFENPINTKRVDGDVKIYRFPQKRYHEVESKYIHNTFDKKKLREHLSKINKHDSTHDLNYNKLTTHNIHPKSSNTYKRSYTSILSKFKKQPSTSPVEFESIYNIRSKESVKDYRKTSRIHSKTRNDQHGNKSIIEYLNKFLKESEKPLYLVMNNKGKNCSVVLDLLKDADVSYCCVNISSGDQHMLQNWDTSTNSTFPIIIKNQKGQSKDLMINSYNDLIQHLKIKIDFTMNE